MKTTEYHVKFTNGQWRVEYDGKSLSYSAWNKRVATSAAKELATKKRPSKVVIHYRDGTVQGQVDYPVKKGKQ